MARCTIDGRPVHAAIKVTPDYPVAVSEHTNEKTSNFTDNRRTKLIMLTIEGVNSDLGDGAGLVPVPGFDDAAGMHLFLSGLQQNPRPVAVSTPLELYPAMNLESYKPVKESKYKRALHYTVVFKEDRTVDLTTTTVKVAQRGQVKKGPVDPAAPPKRPRSFLAGLADTFFPKDASAGRQPVGNPAGGIVKK